MQKKAQITMLVIVGIITQWNAIQGLKKKEKKSQITHFTSTLQLLVRATSPKGMSPETCFHVGKEVLYQSTVPFWIRSIVRK